MVPELRGSDLATVRSQLGREPTVPFGVVVRCTGGHPLVIENQARGRDGTPFPTTHWLTCPDAVKAVSRIEADGWISRLNARYEDDEDFRRQVDEAHSDAAQARTRWLSEAGAWGGVGGTRAGIKCLHAHYAHHLAGGPDIVGRWVADRVEPIHPEQRRGRVAAIDQGTNSSRLLVLEPAGNAGARPTELARDTVITRLGQGVDATGMLAPDALERTERVLALYCRRARALGVEAIRVGATSAVRDASNRDAFTAIVRNHAGNEPEVIEGEREAALSFLGATWGLDGSDGPFAVVDIGGGSTEFVCGPRAGEVTNALSTQLGSVRMTERLLRGDPPTPGDLAALDAGIDAVLDEVEVEIWIRGARTFVAVGGTATTVQAIALGLEVHDPDLVHRSMLEPGRAREVRDLLAAMTTEERAAIPVMPAGRAEVIVAGASILVAVLRRFGATRALISETDILDGLAFEMLGVR